MIRLLWSALNNAIYPLILVMSLWVIYFFNIDFYWHLEEFGLRPQSIEGLKGILLMPFLHENFEHLFSNTIPLLVAGSFIVYYFKNLTWLIAGVVWLLGGLILWLIGEPGTIHIGASGLVYGLVFFLLASGIIRGHRHLAAVALLMIFLYGSLVWGLFPEYIRLLRENISWEGHLGGAISGTLMAFLLINKGPEKPVDEVTLDEEDDLDEEPYWLNDEHNEDNQNSEKEEPEANNEPGFKFRYVPKNANPWEKDD